MPQQPDLNAILKKYGGTVAGATPAPIRAGADLDAILKKYGGTVEGAEPSSPYDGLIDKYAAEFGVKPDFVKAIIYKGEWYGKPPDPTGVSPKKAAGIGQLMPETAKQYGVTDPFDPDQNIRAAVQHIAWLQGRFKGDETKIAAAYNAGHVPVEKHGGVPPYRETRGYVGRVMEGRGGLPPDPASTPGQPVPSTPEVAPRQSAPVAPKPAPVFDLDPPDPMFAPVDVLKTTREGGAQIGRAATGAVEAVKTGDPKVAANAASDLIEGAMTLGAPLLIPAAMVSLGWTAATVAVATAASDMAAATAKRFGFDEAYQRLAGNVAALTAAGFGAKKVLSSTGAVDAPAKKIGLTIGEFIKKREAGKPKKLPEQAPIEASFVREPPPSEPAPLIRERQMLDAPAGEAIIRPDAPPPPRAVAPPPVEPAATPSAPAALPQPRTLPAEIVVPRPAERAVPPTVAEGQWPPVKAEPVAPTKLDQLRAQAAQVLVETRQFQPDDAAAYAAKLGGEKELAGFLADNTPEALAALEAEQASPVAPEPAPVAPPPPPPPAAVPPPVAAPPVPPAVVPPTATPPVPVGEIGEGRLLEVLRERLGEERANDLVTNLGEFDLNDAGTDIVRRTVSDTGRSYGPARVGRGRQVKDREFLAALHDPEALGGATDAWLLESVNEARALFPLPAVKPAAPAPSGAEVAKAKPTKLEVSKARFEARKRKPVAMEPLGVFEGGEPVSWAHTKGYPQFIPGSVVLRRGPDTSLVRVAPMHGVPSVEIEMPNAMLRRMGPAEPILAPENKPTLEMSPREWDELSPEDRAQRIKMLSPTMRTYLHDLLNAKAMGLEPPPMPEEAGRAKRPALRGEDWHTNRDVKKRMAADIERLQTPLPKNLTALELAEMAAEREAMQGAANKVGTAGDEFNPVELDQPDLPGTEGVRSVENKTPEFELPYALTPNKQGLGKKVETPDLLAPSKAERDRDAFMARKSEPLAKGTLVTFMRPTLHGPKKALGSVDFIRPDGTHEIRHDGGIYKHTRDEIEVYEPKKGPSK